VTPFPILSISANAVGKEKKDIEKYTYRIEWSEDDHCHIARCLEFPSLAAHGDIIEEALRWSWHETTGVASQTSAGRICSSSVWRQSRH